MNKPLTKQMIGKNRAIAGIVLAATGGLLGMALYLSPASQGLGTHQQLGWPACGFYTGAGMPCATCGMTTAFSYAAHGNLLASFIAQPAGAMMALLTACLFIVSIWSVASGMSMLPICSRLWAPKFVIGMGALVVIAWGYKIVMVTGWL